MAKKRNYPEQKLQIKCADYLKALEAHTKRFLFWHTPNGGRRSKAAGALFKAMGTKPGVPDLIILLDTGTILFIELKYIKTYLNKNQKIFHTELSRLGYHVETITAEHPHEAVNKLSNILRKHGIREA